MGYYINPKDKTKEQFLQEHGQSFLGDPSQYDTTGYSLLVCLVDNGMFSAAGIAYDKREAIEFNRPDGRRKSWYEVSKIDLAPYYKES